MYTCYKSKQSQLIIFLGNSLNFKIKSIFQLIYLYDLDIIIFVKKKCNNKLYI